MADKKNTIDHRREAHEMIDKWLEGKLRGNLVLSFPGDGRTITVRIGEMSDESTRKLLGSQFINEKDSSRRSNDYIRHPGYQEVDEGLQKQT